MAVKLFFLCVLCVSAAWCGVTPRDLASDINTAEVSLDNLASQAASLRLHSDFLNKDFNIPATNYFNDIENQLVVLNVDAATRENIHNIFTTNSVIVNADISKLNGLLSDLTSTLFKLNFDLNENQAELQADFDQFVLERGEINTQIVATVNSFSNTVSQIDQAVSDAISQLSGMDVTRTFVSLQRFVDNVIKHHVGLDNAFILFDHRATEADKALTTVINQL